MNKKKAVSPKNYGSPQHIFELIPDPKDKHRPKRDFYIRYKAMPYTDSTAHRGIAPDGVRRWWYRFYDQVLVTAVKAARFEDFGSFSSIGFSFDGRWPNLYPELRLSHHSEMVRDGNTWKHVETGKLEVAFTMEVAPDELDQSAFLAISRSIERVIAGTDVSMSLYTSDEDWDSLTLSIPVEKPRQDTTIGKFLAPTERYFTKIVDDALANKDNEAPGIQASFEFPEGLQVPCEQYLLYFSQFLRDLGISADSRLSEQAGKVLFSVIPSDGTEALDRIREALDLYLRLPTSPITKADDNFAAQRLEHQIESLKFNIRTMESERRMLHREIQHQDLLLREQATIIENQQASDNVMIASRIKPPDAAPDAKKKKVFGLTKIKKLEDYGVVVDLGALFKSSNDD